jgi:tyrosyl-tRNA synthetase
MSAWEGAKINEAKEILAFELTKMIHGEEEATKAMEAARAVFSGKASENMPTTKLEDADFTDGSIDIVTILQKAGLVGSRSDGRRACEQGGVLLNDEKVTDFKASYAKDAFADDGVIIKKGKKNIVKVVL